MELDSVNLEPKPNGNFFISDKNIDCGRFTNIWITNHTNGYIFLIETKFIATFFFTRIDKFALTIKNLVEIYDSVL